MGERVNLSVGYSEKDLVKSLGARWDGRSRVWYIPAGVDPTAFEEFLPRPILNGPPTRYRAVACPFTCYRCEKQIMSIVGAWVSRNGGTERWEHLPDVAEVLAALLTPEMLSAHDIGVLRFSVTKPRPDGYFANMCIHCDAVQGEHYLRHDLDDALSEGLRLEQLPVVAQVEVPIPVG